MPNNRLHTDKIKLRSFLTPLYFAGEARRYERQGHFPVSSNVAAEVLERCEQMSIAHLAGPGARSSQRYSENTRRDQR